MKNGRDAEHPLALPYPESVKISSFRPDFYLLFFPVGLIRVFFFFFFTSEASTDQSPLLLQRSCSGPKRRSFLLFISQVRDDPRLSAMTVRPQSALQHAVSVTHPD